MQNAALDAIVHRVGRAIAKKYGLQSYLFAIKQHALALSIPVRCAIVKSYSCNIRLHRTSICVNF